MNTQAYNSTVMDKLVLAWPLATGLFIILAFIGVLSPLATGAIVKVLFSATFLSVLSAYCIVCFMLDFKDAS